MLAQSDGQVLVIHSPNEGDMVVGGLTAADAARCSQSVAISSEFGIVIGYDDGSEISSWTQTAIARLTGDGCLRNMHGRERIHSRKMMCI